MNTAQEQGSCGVEKKCINFSQVYRDESYLCETAQHEVKKGFSLHNDMG